jgi:hypothetical protein
MAAGGFKTFTTGEVLTAADTNNFLMQGVLVFDDAAARDAAITAPVEGQVVYLKDTNAVLSYDGSSYVGVGGSSPLTTKGDLYTFSTVDARLGVGANDTVLTADSAEATGLKWAAPVVGGAWTQAATGSFSGASITVSGLSGKEYFVVIVDGSSATGNVDLRGRLNGDTGSNYNTQGATTATSTFMTLSNNLLAASNGYYAFLIFGADSGMQAKMLITQSGGPMNLYRSTSAITSITMFPESYTFDNGTYYVWSKS